MAFTNAVAAFRMRRSSGDTPSFGSALSRKTIDLVIANLIRDRRHLIACLPHSWHIEQDQELQRHMSLSSELPPLIEFQRRRQLHPLTYHDTHNPSLGGNLDDLVRPLRIERL